MEEDEEDEEEDGDEDLHLEMEEIDTNSKNKVSRREMKHSGETIIKCFKVSFSLTDMLFLS